MSDIRYCTFLMPLALGLAAYRTVPADISINLTKPADDKRVTGKWDITGNVIFSGFVHKSFWELSEQALLRGLHFTNGSANDVTSDFKLQDGNASPVVGVDAANTVVTYRGKFFGDGGSSFPRLTLTKGGKFILTGDASMDFTNDAYFTRQLAIYGDGTGVFEVAEGFVSDNTKDGTVPDAIGSFRVSKSTVITHHTQGLPQHVRLGCLTAPKCRNGHFVFENESGSRWIVKSNHQEYPASIWIAKSVFIETEKDLTHTGVYMEWGSVPTGHAYTHPAAFQTIAPDVVVTKEGVGALNLNGEQAYNPGAVMEIKAGSVNFNCDATGGTLRNPMVDGKFIKGGQDLTVSLAGGATAGVGAVLVRIQALTMADGATLAISCGSKVAVKDRMKLAGNLRVVLPQGEKPANGKSYDLMDWGSLSGTFSALQLPFISSNQVWDDSRLYTEGLVSVKAGDGTVHSMAVDGPFRRRGNFTRYGSESDFKYLRHRALLFLSGSGEGKRIQDALGRHAGWPALPVRY